jgi:hypothetical protein
MWQWPPCDQPEAGQLVTRDREQVCVCVSPLVVLLPINPLGFNHGGSSLATLSNPESLSKGPISKHHSWVKFLLS